MNITAEFPFLTNKSIVYLDNAATTQKPKRMIERLAQFYSYENANVHRGLYPLSDQATELYESTRTYLAKFLNAKDTELFFTSGTTEGVNLLGQMLEDPSKKLNVLLSGEQHHSALLPWQNNNYTLIFAPLTEQYHLDYEQLENILQKNNIDILMLTYVSNVTGAILDLNKLQEILTKQEQRPIAILDAAQALAHIQIDTKNLGVDFLVASAHKAYGPTGLGFVWGKEEMLAKLNPKKFGGGMIDEVTTKSATWASTPGKFEAGTPPIAEVVAFIESLKLIDEYGWNNITTHETELFDYAVDQLNNVRGIKLFIPNKNRLGVISFIVEGIHAHDLSELLGNPEFGSEHKQICLRAGHHCTQILHREIFGVSSTLRLSLAVYNTKVDIDALVSKLNEIIKMLKPNG